MFRVIDDNLEDAPDEARPKRRRSHRRGWRNSFVAHTVIAGLEDAKSYHVFERAIIASLEPRSTIEHELILRLACLFWRLRRMIAIETALFQIHGRADHAGRRDHQIGNEEAAAIARHRLFPDGRHQRAFGAADTIATALHPPSSSDGSGAQKIAESFRRLANIEFDPFERVGAYEVRLWRQAAQTIWLLDALRRPPPAATRRMLRKPPAPHFWYREG